jgi:hypothetical protein
LFRAGRAVGDGEQLPLPALSSVIVHSTIEWNMIVTVPPGVPPVPRTLAFTLTLKTTFCSLPNEVTCPVMASLVMDGQEL